MTLQAVTVHLETSLTNHTFWECHCLTNYVNFKNCASGVETMEMGSI